MKIRLVLFTLILLFQTARAEDLESLRASLSRLREVYAERVEAIRGEVLEKEREILNRFIVSLVRVEQQFRDEGNLDGVVLSRNLRERLLESPEFPEPADNHPNTLKERIEELADQRQEIRGEAQKELNQLNRMYMERLEPIMRGLTRLGDFDTARQLLETRQDLAAGLADTTEDAPPSPVRLGPVGDPNVLPLSLEPPAMGRISGITPRRTQIPFELEAIGGSEARERDFRLSGGQLTVPEPATAALVHQVKQNHMLSLEFGLYTGHRSQGNPALRTPAPLVVFGNNLQDANLVITQEGRALYLYLRTTVAPAADRALHRVRIANIDSGRMEHFAITYRSGELTLFKDRVETNKLRGEVTGQLTNWENYPLLVGWSPSPVPQFEQLHWNGRLVSLYFRASHDSPRAVATHYSRFANFVTSP